MSDDPTGAAFLELGQKHIEYILKHVVAARKCPACGVTLRQVTLDRLRDQGMDGFRCLDKDCPPFETWPEVKADV